MTAFNEKQGRKDYESNIRVRKIRIKRKGREGKKRRKRRCKYGVKEEVNCAIREKKKQGEENRKG